jgi:8-oxo-dGTP pyrophosphatase MutT (NUDIX family)
VTRHQLRHSSRALILDEADAVLLARFDFRDRGGPVVWTAPGGGMDPGETEIECLRRELAEEVGLELTQTPPKVWRHEFIAPDRVAGYDGLVNHFFLLRAERFTPRGAFTDEELAAENVTGFAWWPVEEVVSYDGPDVFSPRAFGVHLSALLRDGVPEAPLDLPPVE